MGSCDFLIDRGFVVEGVERFGNTGMAATLFRRGDLLVRMESDPRDGLMVELKRSSEPRYTSLDAVLRHIGASYVGYGLDALHANIDAILAWHTYSFLVDRGFRLAGNESQDDGSFKLLFRRGGLRLRIEVQASGHVSIDFNDTPFDAWTPLQYLLRHLGIAPRGEGDDFEDLEDHIDRILAFYDATAS